VSDAYPGSFYADGDPHVDPYRLVEHQCARRGITRDQLGVRRTVLGTFSRRLSRFIAERAEAVPARYWLRDEDEAYIISDGVTLATFPIGAPAAVSLMEEMIACGMTSLIVTGAAGSLQPHAPIGTIVLPTSAIREEGTSHHYAPADTPALPSPRVVEALERQLQAGQTEYVAGPTWTTDAVYREHRGKIDRYRQAGVVAVDMELSALLTVAAFRGIQCGGLFCVSDELHGEAWDLGFGGELFGRAIARASVIALEAAKSL
jgi:uridine phosphorylase